MNIKEIEKDFISLLLNDGMEALINSAYGMPKKEWFEDKIFGRICEAIRLSNSTDFNQIAEITKIKKNFIMQIMVDAPISVNPDFLIITIFNDWKRREIEKLCKQWKESPNDKAICSKIESVISEHITQTNFIQGGDLSTILMDEMEQKINGKKIPIPTGFPSIDEAFAGGLWRGELVTVCARPGVGKTGFLKSLALKAMTKKLSCLVISLEMTPKELLARLVSEYAGIGCQKIINPRALGEGEFDAIYSALKELGISNLGINQNRDMTIEMIKGLCKRFKIANGKLDLLILDYLQIVSKPSGVTEKEHLDKVSRELKLMSQELDFATVAGVQLNRLLESRDDKKPKMSDIKGTGNIEQDSDYIITIDRPHTYNPSMPPANVNVSLLKNRNGPPIEKLPFVFVPEQTAFREVDLNR